MDFGSAMSLRFYHVLVLQFRFLHGLPFSELVMRQKSTSTPDVFLLGDEFLHCVSFFGGWIIGLHSGMGVFTVV